MSIEIIEENNISSEPALFLPPVVYEVRGIGRSVLGLVAAAVFVLASLGLLFFDFLAGAVLLPISVFVLVAQAVGFKKSKALYKPVFLFFLFERRAQRFFISRQWKCWKIPVIMKSHYPAFLPLIIEN